MTLAETLEAILANTKLPPFELIDEAEPGVSWRNRARLYFALLMEARRQVLMLAKAAAVLDPPIRAEYRPAALGYDLVMVTDDSAAARDARGKGFAANVSILRIECPECSFPLDFVGELQSWGCTNSRCKSCVAARRPDVVESTERSRAWLWRERGLE